MYEPGDLQLAGPMRRDYPSGLREEQCKPGEVRCGLGDTVSQARGGQDVRGYVQAMRAHHKNRRGWGGGLMHCSYVSMVEQSQNGGNVRVNERFWHRTKCRRASKRAGIQMQITLKRGFAQSGRKNNGRPALGSGTPWTCVGRRRGGPGWPAWPSAVSVFLY